MPSPPWLCTRSRVALLFTAYGEESTSQSGKKGGLRLCWVWLWFLCGCSGLNLTSNSDWLGNTNRPDSEAKQLSVGTCFCLLNNHGKTTSWSRNQRRKNKMGSTDPYLEFYYLYISCPGSLICCLNCGKNLGVSFLGLWCYSWSYGFNLSVW